MACTRCEGQIFWSALFRIVDSDLKFGGIMHITIKQMTIIGVINFCIPSYRSAKVAIVPLISCLSDLSG